MVRLILVDNVTGKVISGKTRNTDDSVYTFLDAIMENFGEKDGEFPVRTFRRFDPAKDMFVQKDGKQPTWHCNAKVFVLEKSDDPFAVYWPQALLESVGIPCFGEEYA